MRESQEREIRAQERILGQERELEERRRLSESTTEKANDIKSAYDADRIQLMRKVEDQERKLIQRLEDLTQMQSKLKT